MREPVTLRASVPRRAPCGVRRALVLGAGEQLREQDREHEVARRVGMDAAAGRCAQREEKQRAQVAGRRRGGPLSLEST